MICFIPFIQASAVCNLFIPPPLSLQSRPPFFSSNWFPLIASYLSSWALLSLFPPCSLVSTQQSSEAFKGSVRARHLSPHITQNKIQSCQSDLLDVFAGYLPDLISCYSSPGSLCSIHNSLLCYASNIKYTPFSGLLQFPVPRTLFQIFALMRSLLTQSRFLLGPFH